HMLKRVLSLTFVLASILTVTAQWSSSQDEQAGQVPAYNAAPPSKGTNLPPILTKDQLWGDNAQFPYQSHAYELAAKIPAVLHPQACYGYWDRMGHNRLHRCFENTHGAQCATCLKELYYSYAQTKKAKTAAQIRKGSISGEWRQVNLADSATMN